MKIEWGSQMTIDEWLADDSSEDEGGVYKIRKPIRLLECFSGLGAQLAALERLDYPYESWKTSDWDVNAVKQYNAIHIGDYTNYSDKLSFEEVANWLADKCVSIDGKKPLPIEKIKHKGERWCRETYNNFIATHNIGSIVNAHAKDFEITDIDKYTYLLTYSWPCTNISVAGRQEGYTEGSGTASSLLWEIKRLLGEFKKENCLPEVLIAENVSQCHGKKFLIEFNSWLEVLDSYGYSTTWADMNAKDYGIPQSRSRCFIVSILKKDANYVFPQQIPLTKCMKDFLEDEVEDKWYLKTPKARLLIEKLIERGGLEDLPKDKPLGNITPMDNEKIHQRNFVYNENGICPTITSTCYKDSPRVMVELKRLGNIYGEDKGYSFAGNVWDKNGLSPALMTAQGGNREPLIIEEKVVAASRGRNPQDASDRRAGIELEQRLEVNHEGICNTLTSVQKDNYIVEGVKINGERNADNYAIRKITCREAFRLMDFTDQQFEKAQAVVSNSLLFKSSGNSIVVNCLVAIIGQMIEGKEEAYKQINGDKN